MTLEKFKQKFGVWIFVVSIVAIIVLLKLIGFPEILY